MGQFKNDKESHQHSLEILNLIYGYDSFLDSLKIICDMGCGTGLDVQWWATLTTREDPPEPRDYIVYGIDKKIGVNDEIRALPNVHLMEVDFEDRSLPTKIDLIWCHDAFQYAINPINTLKNWSSRMSLNGMLVMSLPQFIDYRYSRFQPLTENYCYFNYSISNLVYMLAVNGFDCNDAYFFKDVENNRINLAVYKSTDPFDPSLTSLYDLAEKDLLHPSIVNSLTKYGYLLQADIVYPWLDKDFYRVPT
jgi:hypothetical protein